MKAHESRNSNPVGVCRISAFAGLAIGAMLVTLGDLDGAGVAPPLLSDAMSPAGVKHTPTSTTPVRLVASIDQPAS
jgi:hypothetical protein